MKTLLLLQLVLLIFLGQTAAAQVAPATVDTTGFYKPAHPTTAATPHSEVPFRVGWHIEQMPAFEGGLEGLFCFLYQNNQLSRSMNGYPSEKVFVGFVVDTIGLVRNTRALKGLHPTLDAEALRLVNLLSGRFTPGRSNKRPVAVTYTIPISFPAIAPTSKKLRKRCDSSFTANTR
ncbi:energy transducer TonB [Microvirga sp. STR05]|uniref:Energy transducer TonB n=1 Tax=Hymenobacter duratus TaxID=2771356 RepID=A0ABR8JEK0_9BACT|nr:energy transducer TonB [Hymenobacter duratus]MBD2714003.1 energy transducer TonB [Hymenobacter duratus]MBR7948905.1 energy transducer TonB [Microvirga sp. STR05]